MLQAIGAFWDDEAGGTAVEYGLLLTLVVVGTISAWAGFSDSVRGVLADVADSMDE